MYAAAGLMYVTSSHHTCYLFTPREVPSWRLSEVLQVPAPACQFGRIGVPHGAVRAWTVVYVIRGLARKPQYARRRPQGLKLQLNRARPAAQHVHRSRVPPERVHRGSVGHRRLIPLDQDSLPVPGDCRDPSSAGQYDSSRVLSCMGHDLATSARQRSSGWTMSPVRSSTSL